MSRFTMIRFLYESGLIEAGVIAICPGVPPKPAWVPQAQEKSPSAIKRKTDHRLLIQR